MSHTCKICNKIEYNNKPELEKDSVCFECYTWIDLDKNRTERLVIIKGSCCYVNEYSKDTSPDSRGCGGELFYIKLNNGKVLKTNNLHVIGNVPERFKDLLHDNASKVIL